MGKVIVVGGPTASGKTNLSLQIASLLNAPILNYDSIQFYKEYNIGSAKVTPSEQRDIVHYGIDILSPSDSFSIYNFQTYARDIINNNDVVIMVGGSGLYAKAVICDYELSEEENPNQEDDPNISTAELYHQLKELDPDVKVESQNRRRLVRYLALAKRGIKISQLTRKDEYLYSNLVLYLDIEKPLLEERLKLRLDKMLEDSFIDEVKSLRSKYTLKNAIGYNEIADYLDGTLSLVESKDLIIKRSLKYAKRQKTFFLNQFNCQVVPAVNYQLRNIIDYLVSFLPINNSNYFIIGHTLSGKTTIGKEFAKKIGYGFIDLDDYIEKNFNFSISKMRKDKVDTFREYEYLSLLLTSRLNKYVISCGGGIVDNRLSLDYLKSLNTIFISSDLVTLEKRMTKEEVLKRPMLSEHSIKDLFNLRNGIYKEVTKQIVYNNNENVNEVVSQLEDIVRRKKI